MKIILLELFAGIGGFSKGLEDSGFEFDKHYFSEVDRHAIANYKYNFKDAIYIGSVKYVRHIVRTINTGRRPDDKLFITFGSPCQDFSLAGKGAGLAGSKSSLIKYALFLVRWLRPDIFIWENVKGAYSTNNGADYWAITKAFANLNGYRHEQQLLNTSWFLPQNRERIYSIGHLTGRSEPGVFPITEELGRTNERPEQTTIVRTLTAGGHSGGMHSSMTLIKSNTKAGYEIVEPGDSIDYGFLSSKTRGGRVGKARAHTLDCQCKQAVYVAHLTRTDEAKEIRRENLKTGKDYSPFQAKKIQFVESDVMKTLTCSTQKENLIKTTGIRRLTEIECERLQGFPDDWTKYGVYEVKKAVRDENGKKRFEMTNVVKEIPRSQRYKQCGNAVTVEVVLKIGLRIKNILSISNT